MSEYRSSDASTPYKPPAIIAIRSGGRWVFGEVSGGSEEWVSAGETIPVAETH